MAALFVLALLVAAAAGRDLRMDAQWRSYKAAFGKAYTVEEETVRRGIWEANVAHIQTHNLEADRGLHTFWLGENQYADMTTEEFNNQMNGYVMSGERRSGELHVPSVTAVADTVDWRTKGYVTPIKNQERCGSCWAFSSTGSLEGQTFKKTNKLVSLSEQNLVDCSGREGNNGCFGGLMDHAFTYIRKNKGIDTEVSYPYTAKNGVCKFKESTVGATDTGFKDIVKTEPNLKLAVGEVGPIAVAMDASHPSFHLYKSGVYTEPLCSSTHLDHGVLVVGYGTSDSMDYWLVKNSWGTVWGMEGYFMIERNNNNTCGLATMASYPLV